MAASSSTNNSNNATYSSLSTSSVSAYEVYPDEFVFMNQQYVYKQQKQGAVTTTANSQLQSFYTANQNSSIGKFVDAADALANGQRALAMSKNNSISAANTVQQKTKRVNELMYKINNNPYYNYSGSEMQDLSTYAVECSIKGWYVVQARNILNVISGQILYYEDNCDDSKVNSRMASTEEATITEIEKLPAFTLYPNPNKGNMTLVYDLAGDNNAKMTIFDVTGKLICTYDLQNPTGTIEINESQLHNGIYFYRILVNERIIKTDKIVIIK